MENSFNSLIESATSILIVLPNKPYFDQVAAGLGLYLYLKDKKETTISCPSPMLVEFNRLISVDKISPETGKKNLRISFNNYPAESVERVSADIEGEKLFLTVIPKPGAISPQKEQVEIDFTGASSDLVILIGGANDSHFPILSTPELESTKLLHIGTKDLSLSTGLNLSSFARPASSVSEIIFGLINQSGNIDSDVATNLLTGIEDGSKSFTGSDVTADTFEAVAHLLRSGGTRVQKDIFAQSFPKGSIPQKPYFPQEFQKQDQFGKVKNDQTQDVPPQDWLEPKIFKGTSSS